MHLLRVTIQAPGRDRSEECRDADRNARRRECNSRGRSRHRGTVPPTRDKTLPRVEDPR